MSPVAKGFIAMGLLLVIVGLVWQFGGKSIPLGRLPGDIAIEKDNFRFYFPVTTSILVSILISLILQILKWLGWNP